MHVLHVLREVLRSGRPVSPLGAVLETVLLVSLEAKTPDALVPRVLAALPLPPGVTAEEGPAG